MKEKNLLVFVLVLVIIVLFLLPKNMTYNDEKYDYSCKCIGIKSDIDCIGKKYSCMRFARTIDSDEKGARQPGSNDIIMLIDTSASMQGEKLIKLKKAAELFFDTLDKDDRVALVAYSDKAKVIKEFTGDKKSLKHSLEDLEIASTQEKTHYIPPIALASGLFEDDSDETIIKKLVIFGDGQISKEEETDKIYASIEGLLHDDVCIYSVGFDSDIFYNTDNVVENMADMSYHLAGCGRYYPSDMDVSSQKNAFYQINKDTSSKDLLLEIHSPITQLYDSTEVVVNFSTNIEAECSYSLNQQNLVSINSQSFNVEAVKGNNSLTLMCRREYGLDWEVEKSVDFYVDYQEDLFTIIKDFMFRKEKLHEPSKDEVMSILKDAFENEKLNIILRATPKGKGTQINLMIQNTKPVPLNNVKIRQIIPHHLIAQVNEIQSADEFSLLESNPLVLEFYRREIKPEEVTYISYYINNLILEQDLNSFSTEILFDEATQEQIEELFVIANTTLPYIDVESGFQTSSKGTQGKISITPTHKLGDVNVYLNIPKCMAVHLNEIYFKDQNYKIVAEDPLILWHFDELKDNITIEYELEKKLEDYCEDQLSIIAMADEVGGKIDKPERETKFFYFFPIAVIPVLIIIMFLFMKKSSSYSSKKKSYLRLLMLLATLLMLLWVAYPKTISKGDTICDCFGISTPKKCLGMPHSCSEIEGLKISTTITKESFCKNPSCNSLDKYIKADPRMMNEVGLDLTLLIDQSRSMENEKMINAKLAAISLLSQMKKQDRIAVIAFDNSSRLIQSFSNDRDVVMANINNISLGFTTKYIPALSRSYFNYLSYGNKFNRWMVIFISDGDPGDEGKPDSIYNKVKEMTSEGICINTIGFGEEIYPGSEAEVTLKKMAEISQEKNNCGNYYYAPKDLRTLSDILGRLYKEVYEEKPFLKIDEKINSLSFNTKEDLVVEVSLRSSANNLDIPGSFRLDNNYYCAPEAQVSLLLWQENNLIKTVNIPYDSKKNTYVVRATKLPVGTFDVEIKAMTQSEDGCFFKGSKKVGELNVEKYKGFDECWTDSCLDITKYLFSEEKEPLVRVLITDYAFIPQNISIGDDTTVLWKNIGKKPHTVTSGKNFYDGFFNSGVLLPGESFNKTFKEASQFSYFDNLSVRLKGTMNKEVTKDITFGNFKLEYKKPIDLVLVVDKSASMYGSKMEHLKTAAHKLVDMVYPGDRVALIEFSEEARILQDFTKNRDLLNIMIDRLFIGGSTSYIPALTEAEELFNERTANTDNGKIIVFLSDGNPWDYGKPNSIYDTAGRIIDEDVCIYAVGYGDEVYPGSEAEKLLKKIVNMSQSSFHCGAYKYAPANEIKLVKIFGSIYHEAAGQVKGLVVIPEFDSKIISTNESLTVSAKVRSSFSNNYLPGVINLTSGNICGPPAKVTARIFDKFNNTISQQNLVYKGQSTGYQTQIYGIPQGEFDIEIYAKSYCSEGTACEFTGKAEDKIVVLEFSDISVDYAFILFYSCMWAFFLFFIFKKK